MIELNEKDAPWFFQCALYFIELTNESHKVKWDQPFFEEFNWIYYERLATIAH